MKCQRSTPRCDGKVGITCTDSTWACIVTRDSWSLRLMTSSTSMLPTLPCHLLIMRTTFPLCELGLYLSFKGKGWAHICPRLPSDDDGRAASSYRCDAHRLAHPLQTAFISPALTSGSVFSRQVGGYPQGARPHRLYPGPPPLLPTCYHSHPEGDGIYPSKNYMNIKIKKKGRKYNLKAVELYMLTMTHITNFILLQVLPCVTLFSWLVEFSSPSGLWVKTGL